MLLYIYYFSYTIVVNVPIEPVLDYLSSKVLTLTGIISLQEFHNPFFFLLLNTLVKVECRIQQIYRKLLSYELLVQRALVSCRVVGKFSRSTESAKN